MSKIRFLSLLLLVIGVQFSCRGDNSTFTSEVIDGVRHVTNIVPIRESDFPVSLEFVQHIGDLDAEDENYAFFIPEDMTLDHSGNIYVLDVGNYRIQKFDRRGKFMLSFGGEGQGPGELRNPSAINTDDVSNIVIGDGGNSRFVIFSPDGKPVKTIRYSRDIFNFKFGKGNTIAMAESGVMITQEGIEEPEKTLVQVFDYEEILLYDFGEPADYGDPVTNGSANNVHYVFDDQGYAYLSFYYQNRIEYFDSNGKHLVKIERPLNYDIVIEKTEVTRYDDGGVSIRGGKKNRVSQGIAVDGKRRVWVATLTRQIKEEEGVGMSVRMGPEGISRQTSGNTDLRITDMFELEVYDQDGILLGKIPLNHFVDDIRIFDDRLFILDRLRGMQFYEYKIVN